MDSFVLLTFILFCIVLIIKKILKKFDVNEIKGTIGLDRIKEDREEAKHVDKIKKWNVDSIVEFLEKDFKKLDISDVKKITILVNKAFKEKEQEEKKYVLVKKSDAKNSKTITELVGRSNEEGQEEEKHAINTAPKQWMVNNAIPNAARLLYYFVDQKECNVTLLEMIEKGEFVALHGPRASGKTTRMLQIQEQLKGKGFNCIYVSFEQVKVTESESIFWQTLSTAIQRNSFNHFGSSKSPEINSASEFLNQFQTSFNKSRIILLFDEFDKLCKATEDIKSSCLKTFCRIRDYNQDYTIHSIVIIGSFSTLYLNPNILNISLFIRFENPNFAFEQVQALFNEFADEYGLKIDLKVIKNIYMQTNGHAGLICLCGHIIYKKLLKELKDGIYLDYDTWQYFSITSLGEEIIEYPTFIKMKNILLKKDAKPAMKFFQSNFLANIDSASTTETNNLAMFLTAEGVLKLDENGKFKISSVLTRQLILQRIIPKVFPFFPKVEVPFHSFSNTLNTFEVLKQILHVFDKEAIMAKRSYKIVNNKKVPSEKLYEAEMYRILSNWLITFGFTITGQWHLKVNNKHSYCDIVIDKSKHRIVLELLATETEAKLREHFNRALYYAEQLPANETWVIHFTCNEMKPCWPTNQEMMKGLNFVTFWHNPNFTKIQMNAYYWINANDCKMVINQEINLV